MKNRSMKAILSASVLSLAAISAQAQDWNGAYIGASVSSHSGSNTDFVDSVKAVTNNYDNPYSRNGTMRGLFAGYRVQNDVLVYGAELSRTTGALRMPEPYPENHISEYTTVMGRLGYAHKNALISAGLGYFQGTLKPVCIDICGVADISGLAMSFGVDVLVTGNVTVGAAVTRRSFDESKFKKLPQYGTSGHDNAFEFRIGYNF